ncbi:serine/threonine protein kinase ULK3, putative [Entamoeba invadens IP1]|uniref:Serine/threonine protein kinase ULK3, putative n=3 Tax=Entamoeba invadens TaxID=33085 RepID=A0A0A1UGJ5_ENTIV|nr:serine/threonine protein kinase ULK3, putative [Entamoeba invadens IP1]ELP92717.1 serine/threonine protein kinase ULK3, putative [Entamoeba invadens IP1]|eukprot:XP_004259488.1 serine/threonine protein kinase ULK3, putative [Entamoeba invadens IP1]
MAEALNSEEVSAVHTFTQIPTFDVHNVTPLCKLGEGGFSKVMKVQTTNGVICALKESVDEKSPTLLRDATIMKLLNHPNVVQFYGFAHENISMAFNLGLVTLLRVPNGFLLMEYCDGGNVDSYVDSYAQQGLYLPLNLLMSIFKQIAVVQHYLHFDKGFVHRDIKLENFLLKKHEPYPIVKMTDFGFGRTIVDSMVTFKCTPLFAAPELLKRVEYSDKSELYSLGVCLYRLAASKYPFGATKNEFFTNMRQQKEVEFPRKIAASESYREIIDLTKKLIVFDEAKRLSWEQFYEHPFMKMLLAREDL